MFEIILYLIINIVLFVVIPAIVLVKIVKGEII